MSTDVHAALMYRLVLWVLGSLGLNVAAITMLRSTHWNHRIDKTPKWNLLCCLVYQGVIFPLLLYLSTTEASNQDSWKESALLCLIGFLVKDVMVCKPLTIVHHVLGVVFCLLFLFCNRSVLHEYVSACLILEVANFFLNVSTLCQYSSSTCRAALLAFGIAHCLVARLLLICLLQDASLLVGVTSFISLIVMGFRSREVLRNYHNGVAMRQPTVQQTPGWSVSLVPPGWQLSPVTANTVPMLCCMCSGNPLTWCTLLWCMCCATLFPLLSIL